MKTRKSNIICYDGIGSKYSGVHTRKNFLRAMKSPIITRFTRYQTNIPKSNNLEGWMKWSGAELDDEANCRKMVGQSRKEYKERKEQLRLQQIPGTKEYNENQKMIRKLVKEFDKLKNVSGTEEYKQYKIIQKVAKKIGLKHK
jgi:hypothetical protein